MFENEKVIETKTCKHCGVSFNITDKDLEFYEKVSPVFSNFNPGVSFLTPGLKLLENGKVKYLIPTPTLCPDCRAKRRMSFRNERKLYKRKCDFSEKDIISIYSPDKSYKVYNQEIWWSDKWDALDYGRDFDFSRSFFEQYKKLIDIVPKNALFLNIEGSENSDYTNHSGFVKNCYSSFAIWECEDCFYDNIITNSKKCVDCLAITQCNVCYSCIDCSQCFNSFFCVGCEGSSNLYASYNCIGCQDCIACHNLVNKKFYIENISYNEETYREKSKQYFLKNKSELLKEVKTKTIFPHMKIKGSENCYGDQINNSRNLYSAYDVYDNAENSKYIVNGFNANYVYDAYGFGDQQEKAYEIVDTGLKSVNQYFCVVVHNTSNAFYCQNCYNSSHLFGCIGLKSKSYCIFNKQYTKEEYEILIPKIIEHMMKTGEWGEFFPSSLSPFGYNETIASEYYPINPPVLTDIPFNKGDSQNGVEAGGLSYIDREGNTYKTIEEAISFCHSELDSESLKTKNFNQRKDSEINSGGQLIHGKIFNWSDYEAPFPKVEKIIPANKLPEDISKIPDDILNRAIECEVSKKPFRIIKEELNFYRKHNLPIPKKHPNERHRERMQKRNQRKLYTRNCDKCGKEIQTTYPPERPEIVYCQTCYNREIY